MGFKRQRGGTATSENFALKYKATRVLKAIKRGRQVTPTASSARSSNEDSVRFN